MTDTTLNSLTLYPYEFEDDGAVVANLHGAEIAHVISVLADVAPLATLAGGEIYARAFAAGISTQVDHVKGGRLVRYRDDDYNVWYHVPTLPEGDPDRLWNVSEFYAEEEALLNAQAEDEDGIEGAAI